MKILIQSDHNFAHATTAELSWHVQNYDLIGSLQCKLDQIKNFQRFQQQAHKLFINASLASVQQVD